MGWGADEEPGARILAWPSGEPRWRWWFLVLMVVAVVAGSFAFSAWVGFHVPADDGDFNWELFAIVGTATGTSLLALVTGGLAVVTGADVRASRDIARITSEEQEARGRPIVIVEQVEITVEQDGYSHLGLILRNAGLGAAVRGAVEVRYVEGVTTLVHEIAYATSLLSGETKTVTARVTPSQAIASGWSPADWSVSGAFLDASGRSHSLVDGQATAPAERVAIINPSSFGGALDAIRPAR